MVYFELIDPTKVLFIGLGYFRCNDDLKSGTAMLKAAGTWQELPEPIDMTKARKNFRWITNKEIDFIVNHRQVDKLLGRV